jgi:hypothetical protein
MSTKVSRTEARSASRDRLAEIKASGIKFVKIVGSWSESENCDECKSMRGHSIEVEYAPELPLRGCRKKYCGCTIVACTGI